ncbi:MAG: hypothetical protein GY801_17085 [bacterium]|nr:hypothetical protein [bacterium]
MKKDLSDKTLGIIHAAVFTAQTVQRFIDEFIPEVSVMHLGDDTVQRDNLAAEVGTIPTKNYFKFVTYAGFLQEAGIDMILLGCSTFNRAVEYARPMIDSPMLQIDRPMFEGVGGSQNRVSIPIRPFSKNTFQLSWASQEMFSRFLDRKFKK